MSRLNRRGYSIVKTNYSEKLDDIREKLTVKPFVVDDFGNGKNKSFKLYLESENKLYVPRFYGIDVFGEPQRNKLIDGDMITVKFNGDLREEQKPVFDIAYRYEGMGHVTVISCDLNNHLLFERRDGGANGYEREDNYKDLLK